MTMWGRFFLLGCLLVGLTSCKGPVPEETVYVTSTSQPQEVLTPPSPPKPSMHKIGLLLPLSGPHAQLGQDLLDAAELSLFDADSCKLNLRPYDTALGARKAAEQALKEGVELLIGPIFATDVQQIKPLLAPKKINLLCFSTDQTVAGNGVYLLGFLPSQQIERVIGHLKQQGLTRLAALTPSDPYGKVVDQTLRHLEAKGEITLLGITHYGKESLAEEMPVPHLIADIEMYKMKGLEALLIPEGGETLERLVRLLGDQGALQILGSGQWDSPETLAIAELQGSLFASTPPEDWKNFSARFQQAYGHTPARIAGLAYDAVALAAALEKKGYTAKDLTHPQGFLGTEGLFRLTPEGMNDRGLAILRVTSAGFVPVSPAPQAF